ncbi:hypothetical protein MBLL_01767 (plasmid) [Methylobacterium bullatum]|uniref:Uncharacterized protein n=2 Tax=Methylobacterium bullatum TaxID=570505 RepID=A0A679JPU9_9HYPH|nr:hypothetical protein MBLL_01767 [Methylobacterium bullatum]
MSEPSSRNHRRCGFVPRLALVLGGLLAAGGCSGDLNAMRGAYTLAGGGPKDVKAPDFVVQSRKTDAEYLPVGVAAPARAISARTAEGTKSLENDLMGARGRNEAKGRAAESAARATGQIQPAQ